MITGNEFIDVLVAMVVVYGVVYLFAMKALYREEERRRRKVIERIEQLQQEKETKWKSYLSSQDSSSGWPS
jgi:F0F1-type ATP synthase membrane subunit b/b'